GETSGAAVSLAGSAPSVSWNVSPSAILSLLTRAVSPSANVAVVVAIRARTARLGNAGLIMVGSLLARCAQPGVILMDAGAQQAGRIVRHRAKLLFGGLIQRLTGTLGAWRVTGRLSRRAVSGQR